MIFFLHSPLSTQCHLVAALLGHFLFKRSIFFLWNMWCVGANQPSYSVTPDVLLSAKYVWFSPMGTQTASICTNLILKGLSSPQAVERPSITLYVNFSFLQLQCISAKTTWCYLILPFLHNIHSFPLQQLTVSTIRDFLSPNTSCGPDQEWVNRANSSCLCVSHH